MDPLPVYRLLPIRGELVAAIGCCLAAPLAGRFSNVLRYLKWASPVLVLALFVLALFALSHELRHYRVQDIRAALEAIPLPRFLSALALTVLSYGVLSCYDWLGLRYAGRTLAYGRVALASFSAYVFS